MNVKIKINGVLSKETQRIRLKDSVIFEVSDTYHITETEQYQSHDLLDNEIIEITLNDKTKLSLSGASFLSLFPDTSKPTLNLRDCNLQSNAINTQANLIKIQCIRFLKKVEAKDKKKHKKPAFNHIEVLEKQLVPKEGIFNCTNRSAKFHQVKNPLAEISTQSPILLLLHSSASNTEYTFGNLWHSIESHLWIDLLDDAYQTSVYAFEHYTLAKTPIENALDLVRLLPKGARLHLLTHSRGGLIGELLSRGDVENNASPFSDEEMSYFGAQKKTLEDLNRELINKKIKIERFVRIACPVRGATFANQRADIYFSIVLSTLGLIPALKNSTLYSIVQNLLYLFASGAIYLKDIAGLADLLPESPLIRVLNGSSIRSNADLSIIAGDIEGAGAFKILELLTTHFFFLEQHDLIVNTSSMIGGVKRVGEIKYFFHQGPQVSHFHYFSNPISLQHIVSGLNWKTGFAPEGYDVISHLQYGNRRPFNVPAFDSNKSSVVIIPSVFGSHIKPENTHRIWMNWNALTNGDFTQLKLTHNTVAKDAADGLVAEKYGKLVQFLSQHYNIIPFPYDWRLSLLESSKKLANLLKSLLATTKDEALPVHLLAHSTGGLVARLVTNDSTNVWQEMVKRNSRLLMLGTPQRGSLAIARMLMGKDRLARLLALLHYKNSKKPSDSIDILETLTSFSGLLELMPHHSEFTFYHKKSWEKIAEKRAIPSYRRLKAAKKLQSEYLDNASIDENMFIVLGISAKTPAKFSLENGQWLFSDTHQGDGFATWKSCRLQNIQTWYMNASHGNMTNCEQAFIGIQQILDSGDTNQLARDIANLEPPQKSETPSISRSFIFPTEDELLDASMSVIAKTQSSQEIHSQIAIEVTHGDLSYAKYPLMTGHYDGDGIRSSNIQIDLQIGGYLAKSFELGLYPGPIRTSQVFLRTGQKFSGVIVIGLGRIGTLSANKLKLSVTHGVLDYVRTLQERQINHGNALGISFLLLAGSETGLPLADVLVSILRGVINANTTLESDVFGALRIQHIEFVEWYLDKAARATYYLKAHAQTNEFKSKIKVKPFINSGQGGKERIVNRRISSRWQSLQIIKSSYGELCFTYLTKKARAEATLISTQRKLIDKFIHSSISTIESDSGLSSTLFELIVPLELKAGLSELNDIQLILDENTARYPWELLQGRTVINSQKEKSFQEKPFSVQSGLVRQLILDDYRRQPTLSQSRSALIIGEPELGNAARYFRPLPGAKREAEDVAQILKGLGYAITTRINAKSDAIIQALYKQPYRIIHLSGHGVYQYKEGSQSEVNDIEDTQDSYTGMVLGDGIYLSAKEISQMENVPDIVFVNCCHSGFIEESTKANQLAANLATQLIKNGVICVIAAGWAVNDYAARLFAEAFYNEMLGRNETFGRAVQYARQKVYNDNPNINTWGAYQCYGPHNYRMQRVINITEKKSVTSIKTATDFTLPKELTLALNARAEELLQDKPCLNETQTTREELKQLTRSLPPVWRNDGLLLSSIGNLYRILGDLSPINSQHKLADLKTAKDFYNKAFNAKVSNFSFEAIEHFAQVEICRADCLKQNHDQGWLTVYDGAIQKLHYLTDIAPNSYRLALLGKAYKNKVMLLTKEDSLQEVQAMQTAYQQAREKAEDKTGLLESSSAFNYLLATAAISILRGEPSDTSEYKHWIDQLESIFSQQKIEEKSLESSINLLNYHLVNVFLTSHIVEGKYINLDYIKQTIEALIIAYQEAIEYFDPDHNECDKQLSNIKFLSIISNKNSSPQAKVISQLLDKLNCME